MKIVDVCAFYAPKGGGVRTYVDRKLAAGPRAGHEIVVIAPGETAHVEQRGPGARIVWLPAPALPFDRNYRYFADARALHAELDRQRPDIVEASSPWRSASLVADWRGTAPRSLVMHADPLSAYLYRWFEGVADRPSIDRRFDAYWRHLRRLDARFDVVVSASRGLSRRLDAGGLRRVWTNPMGVDPGLFSPDRRDEGLRKRLLARCALGEDATLLIGIGRHAPEKRWPMVIEAATSAGYRTPVGLVLIGDGRDRARISRSAGDNPHVLLLSPILDRPELARLIASADALIHGCEAETFCIAAAEARASGLPLIVPDAGGAADQAGVGDHVYRSASAASAAEAILRFATARARDDAGAGTIALSGQRTMSDHFDSLFGLYGGLGEGMRRAA